MIKDYTVQAFSADDGEDAHHLKECPDELNRVTTTKTFKISGSAEIAL